MVDSTHSTNFYNHYLITFAILTRTRRFLPFLFIITDSDSEKIVKYVLEVFNEQGLIPKGPQILMSDMATTYINSWRKIINISCIWLYCSWHFLRAIERNINIKIVDEEIRQKVEKRFKELNDIVDEVKFNKKYKSFLIYTKKNASDFYEYFIRYYD